MRNDIKKMLLGWIMVYNRFQFRLRCALNMKLLAVLWTWKLLAVMELSSAVKLALSNHSLEEDNWSFRADCWLCLGVFSTGSAWQSNLRLWRLIFSLSSVNFHFSKMWSLQTGLTVFEMSPCMRVRTVLIDGYQTTWSFFPFDDFARHKWKLLLPSLKQHSQEFSVFFSYIGRLLFYVCQNKMVNFNIVDSFLCWK